MNVTLAIVKKIKILVQDSGLADADRMLRAAIVLRFLHATKSVQKETMDDIRHCSCHQTKS